MSSSSSSSSEGQHKTHGSVPPPSKNDREYVKQYESTEEVPILYEDRHCTDILCLGVGIAFTVVLIILAFSLFNYATFTKSSIPADSDGKLCGVDYPAYPYLYFANPPSIARRICVSKCPSQGDKVLDCKMTKSIGCKFTDTPGFQVLYYNSTHEQNRIGMFCMPADEHIKSQVLSNAHLNKKYVFINSLDVIMISFYIGLALSIIYCILTQCFPRFMNKFAVIGGLIIIAAFTILVILYSTNSQFKYVVAGILAFVFIILLFNYIKYRKAFDLQGIFLDAATKMLGQKKFVFGYILLFIVVLVLFAILMVLEFTAFWAGGHLTFDAEKSIFYQFQSAGSVIGTVFILIQAIWGLSFIKQSFNFCISGNAVAYYYGNDWGCMAPMKFLILKHMGSVIAGSFMTGFFSLGDYIFDLLKPKSESNNLLTKCCNTICCRFFSKIFDLVRSDAMAYINLAGNPYCNSARYCEYLCQKSRILEFSQSSSRTYRLSAHLLIAGVVGILALYFKGTISPFAVLLIVILVIFQCTFFITIHADASEAIMIIFLQEQQFGKRGIQKNQRGFNRSNIQALQGISFRQEQLKQEVFEVTKSQIG